MVGVEAAAAREALAGLVERLTYHNEDNGFCVLQVKARGHRDLVTVVGHAAMISAGEFIQANGIWVNDKKHGPQFKAQYLKAAPPTTAEGIRKYFASGMIKGIGPVYGRRLVEAFGQDVFDVIETSPERLREIAGIGPKRAAGIEAGWADQKAIREIMIFLHANGVSTSRAVRIYKTYGIDAIEVISRNPYQLARDIRGIGFRSADQIAMKLGIEKTSLARTRAGILYALSEAMNDGHCGLPDEVLLPTAAKLLEVPEEILGPALALEIEAGSVIADQVGDVPCAFLAGLHRAEKSIAERLRDLADGRRPWPDIDREKALTWVEARTGLTFADSQRRAIGLALSSKVLVITGGPGVGKTTLVNAILQILGRKDVTIALAAPTGRAAKRLAETTGLAAKTIHRLLEVDPLTGGFKRSAENPIESDLLVIDETSMVDVPLMHALLKAVDDASALILVGDVDQLPSVGPGQVLADIIGSGAVPVVRLTEVFRQAAESQIIANAHRINQGLMPDLDRPAGASDFYFVGAKDPEDGVAKIVEIIRDRLPWRFGLDPVRDVQLLCPMTRGALGARSLNLHLQQALNPTPSDRIEKFGWTFAVGDKVMQIENDYDRDVYNGDVGFVVGIDAEEGELAIAFDGRRVVYDFSDLDRVVLAYATTIHKSQGSEYPAVVIPMTKQHYMMLRRNLLYTGVTRGKRLVILVGEKRAVAIAVKGVTGRRRWAKLAEWLTAAPCPASEASLAS
ncbi:MAG: SF1B family DNA helicase RecD2 [Geminicoccaceae bacterium]